MKRNIALCISILCLLARPCAQVQLQTMLPTVGLVQKDQLWNIVLTNTSSASINGRLELVLSDRLTSQELMTASTAEFSMARGPMLINVNKLNPVSYNYIGIEPDKNINTLLPVGTYLACYNFVRNPGTDKREILVEECVSFDVEPLSPPLLAFPADSSVLEVNPAQFSWTPPVPSAFLNRLHYEIIITEIQASQKAAEAIEENIAFFSTDQVADNFMVYSGAQPVFAKDKWYAWQVTARDEKNYAGKSEVWVFKIAGRNPAEAIINATPYVELQQQGAGKTVAPNGILRFNYFNQLADTLATITVADLGEKGATSAFRLPLVRGQNYLQKDISKIIKVEEGHIYMLTLENSVQEKWYIMFEIKKYK